ncbi:acyltransferase [Paenibacillus sp. P25]|nr:acyltransferase [Paenibacillus sp. P25]
MLWKTGWSLTILRADSKASRYLDALRWFVAVYVMIYHLRPVLFQGYNQLQNKNLIVKAAYLLTSMGYEFVMLFFVLSGYLISSSVLKAVGKGTFSWKSYLINRFTRLWLVLISALVLTSALAQLQLNMFPDSEFFYNNMKWSDFLGNLFFLQGIFFPNYGGNLPLWSLSYEFWYYILFPCLVQLFVSRSLLVKVGYGVLVIGLSVLLGKGIMLYFLIWLLGTLLVVLPKPQISMKVLARVCIPLASALAGMIMLADKLLLHQNDSDLIKRFFPQFIVSVCFAGLIYAILHCYNHPGSVDVKAFNIHVFLAGFSYTLYLTHYPVINLLRVWLGDGRWGTWRPDIPHVLLGLVISIAIMAYAWVISTFTEAQTSEVRSWITRQLDANRFKRRS